ncbi:MAG TPA: diguanylate cyclase, partial [Actinomycetota bacterium]|nr:diguanylate cyclase [Actinomycetota bacterium]
RRGQLGDAAAGGDMLARYGGEEFAALLVGCSQVEAVAILDRVREAAPLGETVSVGVAQWDGQQSPEQLIGIADDTPTRPGTRAGTASPRRRRRPSRASSPRTPIGSAQPS